MNTFKELFGRPRKLRTELVAEPRDVAETARLSVVMGIGFWLVWAVGFSLFLAAFEGRSFGDIFPAAVKTGVWVGVFGALVASFGLVSVRATFGFTDKQEFVARLNMATSQLGYVAGVGTGDFLTFRPSFKTGGVGFGLVSVQLEEDCAVIVGPKMHVWKIVNRLESLN